MVVLCDHPPLLVILLNFLLKKRNNKFFAVLMEINVSKCCLQLGWIFFHYNGPIFFRSTLKSPYDGYNLVFFCSTGNKYIFSKLVDDFTFHFFLAFLLQTFIYTDVSFPCNSIAIIVCYSLLLIF